MTNNLSILIIEDNPGDQILLQEDLGNTSLSISNVVVVNSLSQAFEAIKKQAFSIIFLDLFLPDSSGLDSFTNFVALSAATPIVILSGLTDKQVAVRAISMGAQDFLIKGEYTCPLLEKVIVYSIERKRNLEAIERNHHLLKASEESYRYLFDNNPAAIIIWDADTEQIQEVNQAAINLYGYTREEFVQLTVEDIWPIENERIFRNNKRNATRNYGLKGTCQHTKKNKELMYIDISSHSIMYKGREVVLNLANDITEKLRLEEKLAEEKIKKQYEITDAVISAQEKERYFLGVELHDNINQILATSKLYLECATSTKTLRKDLVDGGRELVMKAMTEIRNLSRSLLPPSLGQVGLIDALGDLISKIEKAKTVQFVTKWENIKEGLLCEKLKLTIFRIVQEQINNIFKHAQASVVNINLSQQNGKIELTVTDNGIGFDTQTKKDGVGLQNIESRADLFNGQARIYSKPGEGCTLKVAFILATP